MDEIRTIKKYSNRRLYDTFESNYITLADVRQLVIDNVDFVVIEASSGEDLTRQILLQVISEQELGEQPMLTKELLSQMIRFYGGAFQGVFTDYLDKTADLLNGQHQAYQQQFNEMLSNAGMSSVGEMTQQNLKMWNDFQQQMLKMYGFQPKKDDA